eukprot:3933037-Rhodomonas_salina.1
MGLWGLTAHFGAGTVFLDMDMGFLETTSDDLSPEIKKVYSQHVERATYIIQNVDAVQWALETLVTNVLNMFQGKERVLYAQYTLYQNVFVSLIRNAFGEKGVHYFQFHWQNFDADQVDYESFNLFVRFITKNMKERKFRIADYNKWLFNEWLYTVMAPTVAITIAEHILIHDEWRTRTWNKVYKFIQPLVSKWGEPFRQAIQAQLLTAWESSDIQGYSRRHKRINHGHSPVTSSPRPYPPEHEKKLSQSTGLKMGHNPLTPPAKPSAKAQPVANNGPPAARRGLRHSPRS